jgi:hypothetical protein
MSYSYPQECVIKPTHLSGPVIVRRSEDERPPNLRFISSWFRKTYEQNHREPNYRGLEAKVIVEELLSDSDGGAPTDYKVYCFHGKPALVLVVRGRFGNLRETFYSCDWDRLDLAMRGALPDIPTARPRELPEMLRLASELSKECSFLRVDFYITDKGLKVGELTSFPLGGLIDFRPKIWDTVLGAQFANPGSRITTPF